MASSTKGLGYDHTTFWVLLCHFFKINEQTTTKKTKQKPQTTQQTQIALKSVRNTNPSKHMPYNSHTSNEV